MKNNKVVVYNGVLGEYPTGGDCFAGRECRIELITTEKGREYLDASINDDGWVYSGDDVETELAIYKQAFMEKVRAIK